MLQRRLSVAAGANAGIYFPRDEWDTGRPDNRLGLPCGEFEIPVLIRERGLDTRRTSAAIDDPWYTEFSDDLGDYDRLSWPELELVPAIYRLRLVNGCGARCLDLDLSGGWQFLLIGRQGRFLEEPRACDRLQLAPCDRADVLVDLSALPAGSRLTLRNRAPIMFPAGLSPIRREPILQFRLAAASSDRADANGWIAALPALLQAARTSAADCGKSSQRGG